MFTRLQGNKPSQFRRMSALVNRGHRRLRIEAMVLGGLLHLAFSGPVTDLAEIIDRLVAVVNRQIITLGDVEQELKMQELDPTAGESAGASLSQQQKVTQELALQRLIEQTLIREQIQQFPGIEVTDEEINSQLTAMQNKAGGAEKLAAEKIDLQALRNRLQWQLQVMKFIDYRFRQFVVVDPKEIEAYYQNQFLPELRKRGAQPEPALAEVEEKIRKILTEEKLNVQVDEWLASLRKDAAIEIFH
ncbi:MAG: SurA N-terminal domain-containing protein [Acidobacteria bacterium]|nr:SurA N-terminal domain-containing protein [Acidobacteriota bacterium]MCI0721263.1 SurA N-terminal domain-containing protein [Acidobacteriota bacterium]